MTVNPIPRHEDTSNHGGGATVKFDLSRNELHLDPLPQVRDIVGRGAATLNRYPHHQHTAHLIARIAALQEVPRDKVVVGAGIVGVLDGLLHADATTKGSTVFAAPAFDEYAPLVARAGGTPVAVDSDPPGSQSLAAVLARVDASTRQVIIAAPHNPTGAAVSLAELVGFRAALPNRVVLVIDQAYAEFDEAMPSDSVRRLITGLDSVVVLRSFSKAYGLAGLRIGYGVCSSADLADRIRSAIPAYSVNSLALAAAAESLQYPHQLRDRVSDVARSRQRLEAFLIRHRMFSGIASQANFVWLPTTDSQQLFRHARADGILLREYPGLGVRITVQSNEPVDALMESLAAFPGPTRHRAATKAFRHLSV